MALEGPQLVYARATDDVESAGTEDTLSRALRLAREIEELLGEVPSTPAVSETLRSAHSTRIARAMAASLIDELEAVVGVARAERKNALA